jgi:hypothetical protein
MTRRCKQKRNNSPIRMAHPRPNSLPRVALRQTPPRSPNELLREIRDFNYFPRVRQSEIETLNLEPTLVFGLGPWTTILAQFSLRRKYPQRQKVGLSHRGAKRATHDTPTRCKNEASRKRPDFLRTYPLRSFPARCARKSPARPAACPLSPSPLPSVSICFVAAATGHLCSLLKPLNLKP